MIADVCVWHPADQPPADMSTEACFNGKNICVDCCVAAGDPCGHEAPADKPEGR